MMCHLRPMQPKVCACHRHRLAIRRQGLGIVSFLLALVMLASATLSGCGPSKEQRETAKLLGGMDRLRAAKGAKRKQALADLKALPLETKRAKEAQSACAKAYQKLHQATDLIATLESKRQAGKLDLRALAPLNKSQQMLAQAKMAGKNCEQALRKLNRK